MSDLQRLKRHMSLKSIEAGSLTFEDFLGKLKETPEIADTAPALIVRAIKSRGVVEIEKEPVERQGYLRLLQSMRIPAWKAFDHVRGSQGYCQSHSRSPGGCRRKWHAAAPGACSHRGTGVWQELPRGRHQGDPRG